MSAPQDNTATPATNATSADPLAILEQRFEAAIRAALGDNAPERINTLITPARNPDFGDFQSNAAMPLAKATKSNPRELAQQILEHLDTDDIAETPSIAGPGFINITLKPSALNAALEQLDTPNLGITPPTHPETVVVDLCGVNLAKQMHVGHLRATVIGDAIARLHERLGNTVVRQNHFGDWGRPIAMVTRAIIEGTADGSVNPDTLTVAQLERLYKDANLRCSADHRGLAAARKFDLGPKAIAELEEQVASAEDELNAAKQTLVKLQSGDEATLAVWRRIAQITLDDCFENCRRLQANVTHEATAGESSYRDELAPLIEDLTTRNVAEESDGALVVDVKDAGIKEPCLVRKSDGGFLYATTDIAAIRRRVQTLHADRVIYAVDARQSLHFSQVFAAAIKAGYAQRPHRDDNTDATLAHAAFGTILGPDNKPLKSRSGDNVKLRDLLEEAVQRATLAVRDKNPDLPEDEASRVAEAVGIGAIKYADLSSDRVRDYVMDFDRMLAFEGDTGPYLQYAHVRVRSILRKAHDAGIDTARFDAGAPDKPPFNIAAPEEKTLALQLLRYPATLTGAADACEPHRVCAFLFDLAQAFSSFFTACPVLKAPDDATRDARLRLAALTGRVLNDALNALGIQAPERM